MSYSSPPPPPMPQGTPSGHSAPPPYGYPAAPPYGYPAPPPYGYAPPPLPGPPPELVGSPGMRLVAKLVDTLIVVAMVGCGMWLGHLGVVSAAESGEPSVPLIIAQIVLMVFAVLFYDPVLTATGGTVGKRACGLKVVRLESGQRVGFGAALGRHLMAMLINSATCIPLAYLWCTWDKPHHQGLHDKIVRTVVIRTR